MKKPKFVTLIQRLSKAELKRFDSFLNGCYSTHNQPLHLFNYIKQTKQEDWNFETAHLDVFKKPLQKKQDRKNISNILSRLSDALDEFLILENLKKNTPIREFLVLQAYQKLEYGSVYESKIKDFEKAIKKNKEQDIVDFWYPFLLQHHQYYSSKNNKFRKNSSTILDTMKKLDHFFLRTKLQYACELESRRNLLTEEPEVLFIDDILEKYKELKVEEDIFIQAYFHAYIMIKNKDENDFQKLKNILYDSSTRQVFTASDQNIIHTYLLNFCSYKIRQSAYQFVEEMFLLNKFGLEEGLVLEHKIITATRYNNIIDVACNSKEIKWAIAFAEEYSLNLQPEIRTDAYELALAQIKFAKKEFDDVIPHLSQVSTNDPILYLRTNLFLISTYYEKEKKNADLILNNCIRFDAYFNSKNLLSQEIKTGVKNFSRMVKMLVRGNKNSEQLKEELDSFTNIYFKWWLEEKIKEMKN